MTEWKLSHRYARWVLLLPPGRKIAKAYRFGEDDFFCWGLEPGEYLILGFLLGGDGGHFLYGRIGTKFNIGRDVESVYIGNLKVEVKSRAYRVGIEDEYSTAVESFKNRFPKAQQLVKSLMTPEEAIGDYEGVCYTGSFQGLFWSVTSLTAYHQDTVSSYWSPRYGCSDEWGVKCSKRYGGVTPLSPKITDEGFLKIKTLKPKFQWKPSSRKDVTYDLILYDAAPFSRSGLETDFDYVPGRVIVYVENIREPAFRLKNPLQPGNKYYWSVRLRRNQVVTKWSRFAYFNTVMIATAFGYGQWFNFETPPK
jgi:hypothetical protein